MTLYIKFWLEGNWIFFLTSGTVSDIALFSEYLWKHFLYVSETSLRRILHKELKPIDHPMRFRFAKCVCYRLTKDDTFVIFSDEAHFDLGGYVNKQNCRIWVTEILHAYFLLKWAKSCRYTQWRSLSRHVERIFVNKNLVSTGQR